MIAEPNDLIAEATDSKIGAEAEQTVVVSSSIDSVSDIDLYQFQLNTGQGITLDIDTIGAANNTANFDSYLRVFDAEGNELAVNDDFSLNSEEFSLDSYIGFIANKTGEYYVGVSSTANNSYNPVNGDNVNQFQDNFVPGDYDLAFDVVEVITDEDSNNTISEANIPNLDTNSVVDGEISVESDVDIFKVELGEGEGIKLKANANQDSDLNLDSYLRVFDAEGNELAFDDNSTNNPAEGTTTDSTIDFAPETPGEYYVGVSSAGNFDYDPVNGDTNLNFSPNNGFSEGKYQLELDVVEIVPDKDPDNTIAEAIDSGVSSSERNGTVSGEINPELDADLYKVQLEEGDGIYLDINAEESGSDLDSFVRIFDSEGNELTFDDNDEGNITENFSNDSAIAFAPDTAGEYYVGVSASGNFDYDPVNGRTNFSSNVTSPFSTVGDYDLQIEVASVVADEDTDNTIAEAIDTGVSSTGETKGILKGAINPASDVDFYQFELNAGEGVTLDIDAATLNFDLDAYLRLFDAEGNELAFDDDDDKNVIIDDTTTDSLINFIAETSGEYYVGVSSEGNTNYNAIAGSNNFNATSGLSQGNYELIVETASVVGDKDPDNTIAEAVETDVNITDKPSATISDAIDTQADVDIYQFQLNQGDTVSLDIDAAILDSGLDSVLQLFDESGNAIVNNDDGVVDEETSSVDSAIEFTAATSGTYYVGVSSFANFDYDAIAGGNNFSNNFGSTTGDYDLTINVTNSINAIDGTNESEILTGTAQPDLIDGKAGNDTISGAARGDNLLGNGGNDSLAGNNGEDVLQGGKDDDTLFGGAGDDTLTGDAGSDVFILNQENSNDLITDFEDGTDKIRLLGSFNFGDIVISSAESDSDTIISISDRTIATISNIDSSLITQADFL